MKILKFIKHLAQTIKEVLQMSIEDSYKKFREKHPQMSSFEIRCYESGFKDAVEQNKIVFTGNKEECEGCRWYDVFEVDGILAIPDESDRNAYDELPEDDEPMSEQQSNSDLKIRIAILESASDMMGIYPKATQKKFLWFRYMKKRTKYQDGWNKAIMEHLNNASVMEAYVNDLTPEQKEVFVELVDNEVLYIDKDKDENIRISINCNDLFYWGCADCELIKPEEFADLVKYKNRYKESFTDAWCCFKRNLQPQKPVVKRMKENGLWTDELESLPKPHDS